MQKIQYLLITGCIFILLLAMGCAHYPLDMSETEWNRLTSEQQFEARQQQAVLNHERDILRETKRLEREALKAEQIKLQHEKDVANGMIYQAGSICMGGSRCPDRDKDSHIYSLGNLAFVDTIVFSAHDNVGNKHGATLAIYADNHLVADNVDIKRQGSTQTLFVGKIARNIVIKVRNDDEVYIESLKVFGELLDPEKTRIIIHQ
ncbi:MAG: hypothetical protein OCC46_13895 [Pseudodesulfovibrio sp.]